MVEARLEELPTIVPERYERAHEIARGGFGRITAAFDRHIRRPVAIKELADPAAGSDRGTRLVREAFITASLQHPAIVPVYEAGRWPDGSPFFAMKLVDGKPLTDVFDQARTPDERLALLPHVVAVAAAIAYAHGREIIHRDLKPGNVLVGPFGEWCIVSAVMCHSERGRSPRVWKARMPVQLLT